MVLPRLNVSEVVAFTSVETVVSVEDDETITNNITSTVEGKGVVVGLDDVDVSALVGIQTAVSEGAGGVGLEGDRQVDEAEVVLANSDSDNGGCGSSLVLEVEFNGDINETISKVDSTLGDGIGEDVHGLNVGGNNVDGVNADNLPCNTVDNVNGDRFRGGVEGEGLSVRAGSGPGSSRTAVEGGGRNHGSSKAVGSLLDGSVPSTLSVLLIVGVGQEPTFLVVGAVEGTKLVNPDELLARVVEVEDELLSGSSG